MKVLCPYRPIKPRLDLSRDAFLFHRYVESQVFHPETEPYTARVLMTEMPPVTLKLLKEYAVVKLPPTSVVRISIVSEPDDLPPEIGVALIARYVRMIVNEVKLREAKL